MTATLPDTTSLPEIIPLTTRIAYQNPWMRLREDTIRRADGTEGLYGVIERPDFVVVAALGEGCLTLVEQYRYPVGRRLWELPMGSLESKVDAPPAEVAATELREETGLVAARLEKVGAFLQGPGYCNQLGHVFLATGLRQGPAEREASELGMVAKAVPVSEMEAMIRDGRLVCAVTIAAFGLLRVHGAI